MDAPTNIYDQLKRDEGVRFDAYQDTLGNWTIGVGHKIVPGDFLTPPCTIDQDRVDSLQFHHFLGYFQAGDWENASKEMLDSEWAGQVGDRAVRLSQQLVSGQWV